MRKVAAGGVFISPRVAELLATDSFQSADGLPHTLLTNREFEIFSRIVRGLSLTAIAKEFSLSVKTVSSHKTHILDKMHLSTQVDLVRYAMDHNLLDSKG
jgi:DNA-binding NarL/FixJ family response regulator